MVNRRLSVSCDLIESDRSLRLHRGDWWLFMVAADGTRLHEVISLQAANARMLRKTAKILNILGFCFLCCSRKMFALVFFL